MLWSSFSPLWVVIPSHLASTKEWPKLRFASPFEQATVPKLTNTYAWFSFPEHSGIGEIGGCRFDPQPCQLY